MNKYLLSLCIPPFNRASYLDINLKKLAKIIDPKTTEIVLSDDGSKDNTKEVVMNFIKSNPKIKVLYKQNKTTIGFDRNVLQVINLASGKFCWLLGDDDTPTSGSLKKIISVILKYPNLSLIHLNYSRFDNVLKKVTAKRMVNGIHKDMYFKNYQDFYFKPIKNSYFKFLGTHTITMSSDVVNRSKWMKIAKSIKKYIGHNFIHSFAIGTIIKGINTVYFIAKPQVQYLSNNHRVWPNDIWKDYNNTFLNYLLNIGYPKEKIELMKAQQLEYEKREAISKNKILSSLYFLALRIYNTFRN